MKKAALVIAVFGVVAVVWFSVGKRTAAPPTHGAGKTASAKPVAAGGEEQVAAAAHGAGHLITNAVPQVGFASPHPDIADSLRTVFGLDEQKDYPARVKAAHRLGKNLSESEVDGLYLFLNRKNGEDNLDPSELDALKNEVSMAIMGQDRKSPLYARNLAAMYFDPSHDEAWRDYCIQHLGQWCAKADASERTLVSGTLWDAAGKKQLPVAGTALIALSNNAGAPGIARQDVANKALALCEDAGCCELAKTTALQICARLGDERALPIARKIAESGASVPLRMSALAAVGTLGDASDKPLLEKFASSSDVRLRKSALGALGRLK